MQLEVIFEVPQAILTGLNSGAYKRIGGVIVERSSNEIVAWLRDGGASNLPGAAMKTVINPFNSIVEAARIGTNLVDGYFTRRAVGDVKNAVDMVQVSVNEGMHLARLSTQLAQFTASGQIVNLALTAASSQAIAQRLDGLQVQLENLEELIRNQFKRDRDTEFQVALESARQVEESTREVERVAAFQSATKGLYGARLNFLKDYDELVNKSGVIDDSLLTIAQHHLIRAIYADTSRMRCYLDVDDVASARKKITGSLEELGEYVKHLIELWLGENQAVYFYKDISTEHLSRFLQIKLWLAETFYGYDNPVALMLHIIDELRQDFWNKRLIEDKYDNRLQAVQKLINKPMSRFSDRADVSIKRLDNIEILIENFDRLIGFSREVEAIENLSSYSKWVNLTSDEDIEVHGIGIIYDAERLMQ